MEELKQVQQIRQDLEELRSEAVRSVCSARTALRMARVLEILREAAAILAMEERKIEDGTFAASDLARAALGWNLNSVQGRLSLCREILEGKRD